MNFPSLIPAAHAVICNRLLNPNCDDSAQVNQPDQYVSSALGVFFTILLVATVLAFIYFLFLAGYNFIIAHGDAKRIEEAQSQISYAFIGLIIIFSIYAIIRLIGTIFNIPNIEDFIFIIPNL